MAHRLAGRQEKARQLAGFGSCRTPTIRLISDQRLAMYIVISNPNRMSVYAGVVQVMVLSPSRVGGECNNDAANMPGRGWRRLRTPPRPSTDSRHHPPLSHL